VGGDGPPAELSDALAATGFYFLFLPSGWGGIYHVGPDFAQSLASTDLLTTAAKLQETID